MNTLKYSRGKNHHKTPTTDKREMTKEQNCVISCKAQAPSVNILICDTETLIFVIDFTRRLQLPPLRTVSYNGVRDVHERSLSFPVIINILSGDHVWSYVQDERAQHGGECSLITNYSSMYR